ncbi:hypothetical protein [Paenibacillus ferrarius]|nr:hypothetical protein [Paenibacillus ferrarius]
MLDILTFMTNRDYDQGKNNTIKEIMSGGESDDPSLIEAEFK